MSDDFDITLERKLESKADGRGGGVTDVRRIELITGTGRRRRWSSEDKARIVVESLEPGGRIEIDSNTVERSIRGLALTRKNALFAGHDRGAAGWAMIASLLETCKLNAVDPLAWTTDVLTKLVNRWPASRIDELMPWAYVANRG